jgi:hypothetical protein
MKHVSLLLIIVLAGLYAFAQQSLTIPYQALVRDANGNPVANQQIEAKITLLQDSIAGTEVFSEVHQLTTNSFGQMEIQIGSSDTTAFDNIDWSASKMYIKLEVDLEGGTNNQEIGTHQLLAVPYAKYAEKAAGWEQAEGGVILKNGKVGIGTSDLSNSQTNLQVYLDDPDYGGVRIKNLDSTESTSALFRVDASALRNNALRIQRDGNVGIGTNNPRHALQVGKADGTYAYITSNGSVGHNGGLLLGNSIQSTTYRWKLSGSYCNTQNNSQLKISLVNASDLENHLIEPMLIYGNGAVYINGNLYSKDLNLECKAFKTFIQNKRSHKSQGNTNPAIDNLTADELEVLTDQDANIDLAKMNMFLIEKIDQLIQNSQQQQKQIELQQREIEELNSKFENFKK